MSELKPRPFCGSENIAVGSDKGTVYRHNTAFGDLTRSVPTVRWAYCVDCGCVAPSEKVNNFDGFYKPDEQEDALNRAISAWNRRAERTGRWIRCGANDMHGFDFHCSECNKSFHLGSLATIYDVEREWIHCPSCGACMIGGEDDAALKDAHKPGGEQE